MTRAALEVRVAMPADAAAVAALAAELGYPTEIDVMRGRLARTAASPMREVALAERREGGDVLPVGWIELEERENVTGGHVAEITGLVVAATARRSGVGRALIAYAESWARARGLTKIRVRSNARRVEAADFYPAAGFDLEKMQRVFVKGI
ncbi:MAG: GNAT family N-acetyltransferase [Phycisphaerae bacterium]|nr:GNAT family N-acetyltransferase [Phycisphaerae bacterium]